MKVPLDLQEEAQEQRKLHQEQREVVKNGSGEVRLKLRQVNDSRTVLKREQSTWEQTSNADVSLKFKEITST